MTGIKKRGSRKGCGLNHIKLKHPVTMPMKCLNNSRRTLGLERIILKLKKRMFTNHFSQKMLPNHRFHLIYVSCME